MNPLMYKAAPAAAITFLITGTAAYADVTASDVWSDWTRYMASFGHQVSGEESQSGDTLTVTDVTMSMEVEDGDDSTVAMVSKLGTFELIENGDGSVSMVLPEVMPITMAFTDETETTATIQLEYRTTGLDMTVSGDPEAMTYKYTADAMTFALLDVDAPEEEVDIGTMEITVSDMTGRADITTEGELRSTRGTMSSGPVTYTVDLTDPETGEEMQSTGTYTNFSYTGTASTPFGMGDAMDMVGLLEAGFDMSGQFEHGGGSTEFSFTDAGQEVSGTTQTARGRLDLAMSDSGLSYGGSAEDMKVKVSGDQIPFPVEINMKNSGFGLSMPVSSSDEPQDFSFSMLFGDFTISDQVWAMFDPAGQLPRDPATLSIDLAGKAKMLVDMMDPEAMEEVETSDLTFGELNALAINDITVRAVGAELTGEGDFTFDNSDLTSFDGMPAPEGDIDLKLVGGNGLLDKLVTMGVLPEDQATGARMMMGLFAVPSEEEEDTLTSTIVVNEEGHVLANGQRLK